MADNVTQEHHFRLHKGAFLCLQLQPKITVPFEDPADVVGMTSVPSRPSDPILATTNNMSQLNPGKTTFSSSSPFTVKGDESAETNLRLHGHSLDRTIGSAVHIRSNTVVAKIVTWHPVSIIKSISISFAQPVRNQGAAEPTAPTTMASPTSG